MFAGADVVAHGAGADGVIDGGEFIGAEAWFVEEAVDGFSVFDGQEFAQRVGVFVFDGARHVDWSRGDEGDEHVLIDGEIGFAVVVFAEVAAEPVGEVFVDEADGFAEDAFAEGRAAAAGVVGDGHGEAWVGGGGPEGGFAETRVADDSDAGSVDCVVGFQVVEGAAEAPGPSGDGAPLVGVGPDLAVAVEEWVDAVLEAVVEVRIDVAAAHGGEGVAAVDDVFHWPTGGFGAARGCGCFVVDDAAFRFFENPGLAERDGRVGMDGLVAEEVQAEKCGGV